MAQTSSEHRSCRPFVGRLPAPVWCREGLPAPIVTAGLKSPFITDASASTPSPPSSPGSLPAIKAPTQRQAASKLPRLENSRSRPPSAGARPEDAASIFRTTF